MSDNQKIIELEIQLAHLQRLFDDLNEVVTSQSLELDQMRRSQQQMTKKLNQIKDSMLDRQGADPMDEKPPHY